MYWLNVNALANEGKVDAALASLRENFGDRIVSARRSTRARVKLGLASPATIARTEHVLRP